MGRGGAEGEGEEEEEERVGERVEEEGRGGWTVYQVGVRHFSEEVESRGH